ncbi:MAG: OadG family protein [Kiritimatiellae bacterium]|nr:OadG family protein [Kiritimatiellia bacterium]
MEELAQGLVLMVAGMGIVYLFLLLLIFVSKHTCAFVARFNGIFPEEAPKKAPRPATAGGDDEAVALAIAVALQR